MLHRRRLLQRGLAALAAGALVRTAARIPAGAASPGQVVLVRQSDGVVAVDPRSGETSPVDVPPHRLPGATPAGAPRIAASPSVPDGFPNGGEVSYWMTTPDGGAYIARRSGGAWWYWRVGEEPRPLPLPDELEPAWPSGSDGRWFHGAAITVEQLGSGTLRLMAVDLADGAIVLDHELDRRLELAATAVSEDGAVVAHVQAGNARVDIWLADLRREAARVEVSIPIDPPAPVAASAIDLRVAEVSDGAVIAVGLSWAWPDHPEPMVVIVSIDEGTEPMVTTTSGELIGIVTASR